jgi:hypothetical protein
LLLPFPPSFAAFYCDCEHAIGEVTQGHRLCLVYNLVWKGNGPAPALTTTDDDSRLAKAMMAIRAWEMDPKGPSKLIYVLEHEYTSQVGGLLKPICAKMSNPTYFVFSRKHAELWVCACLCRA